MSGIVREIAAALRPVAAEFRAGGDAYEVLAVAATGDEAGGWTEAESVVEAGTCILVAGNLRPEERVIAERQGAVTPYALRALPWDTTLTERRIVRVAGRRFEVLGVLRAEAANAATTAICEERT